MGDEKVVLQYDVLVSISRGYMELSTTTTVTPTVKTISLITMIRVRALLLNHLLTKQKQIHSQAQ